MCWLPRFGRESCAARSFRAEPTPSRGHPVSGDRIVVVGGGLAGIAASLLLAEAGLPVTVLEARPWLGGATWSFGRRGLTIDNGQHVFLRCFTAYRELLAKLGVSEFAPVQDRLDVSVVTADDPLRLRRSGWPAPTHLTPILARYRPLAMAQRLGVLPAATAMWLSDLSVPANANLSIGDWLHRHGQDERAVRLFWELFLAPFMNASAADTDLGTAASFINVALLSRRDHADLGIPAVPLRELHAAPAARRLAELGAEVRLGAQVTAVRRAEGGGYRVQLDAGRTPPGEVPGQLALGEDAADVIDAAGVVLAVPAWSAAAICPEELAGQQARWTALSAAPVVSVHVIYETRVTRLPFALAAGSPLRWIADKTATAGLHTGQYLAASIPAAGPLVDQPPAALRAIALPVLERLFPAAATAKVEDFFVTRERSATFVPLPGSRALRPDQVTSLPGLTLAGAWTDTGWPDTMEGAVRSGRLAAEAIVRVLSSSAGRASVVPSAAAPAGPVSPAEADSGPPAPAQSPVAAESPLPAESPVAESPVAESPHSVAPALAALPEGATSAGAVADGTKPARAAADSGAPDGDETGELAQPGPATPSVQAASGPAAGKPTPGKPAAREADQGPAAEEPAAQPVAELLAQSAAGKPAQPAAGESAGSGSPGEDRQPAPEPVPAVPELTVVPSPSGPVDGKVPGQRGRQQSKRAARQSRPGPTADGGAANSGAASAGAADGGNANAGAASGGAANTETADGRGKPAARP
jgi:squalene-associated FAD-dependent desaturase